MKIHFLIKRLRNLLLGFAASLVVIAVFYILSRNGVGIPCLFRKLTSFACPGCGNSRAALALLQLDVPAAFRYNPMFLLEFFYLLWVLFYASKAYLQGKSFSYKPPYPWLDIILLIVIFLWWPIRNLI